MNAISSLLEKRTPPSASTNLQDDGVRVTVLGYHDFSTQQPVTAMRIHTETFAKQMQALKDLGYHVIALDDFLAWKRGEKRIPDKSVLITIDDGWKSVYTQAYPVLKRYGYPFTVFLYTQFLDTGSKALTSAMIAEMQKHGCSIGSHSISHPYPSAIKKEKAKGDVAFKQYLRYEMGKSAQILEKNYKQKILTYAYPGGFYLGEMLPIATECGYECLFTVLPGKVTRMTSNFTLPRYIILGNNDKIFAYATSFKPTATDAGSPGAFLKNTPYPVLPAHGSTITKRLPTIQIDLTQASDIDPDSLTLHVEGFGKVKAHYDTQTKKLSWTPTRKLRSSLCKVQLNWRKLHSTHYETPIQWFFRIDLHARYTSLLKENAPDLSTPPE